ncbi:hypothetical protein JKP88DRAFT_279131 [Tribonema minus]|uniref:GH26 domain-containing protein n=1 Tax=Tribonema minus TaxID=303371 RepID=A0A836CEH9_9STRA|nr:hypothetical protein JKP88DRAFT_279131 [Tribonema minus]
MDLTGLQPVVNDPKAVKRKTVVGVLPGPAMSLEKREKKYKVNFESELLYQRVQDMSWWSVQDVLNSGKKVDLVIEFIDSYPNLGDIGKGKYDKYLKDFGKDAAADGRQINPGFAFPVAGVGVLSGEAAVRVLPAAMWQDDQAGLRQLEDPGYRISCDPTAPMLAALHPGWRAGGSIGDAAGSMGGAAGSTGNAGAGGANCTVIASPHIKTIGAISQAAAQQTPFVAAYVVVLAEVLPGQQLFKQSFATLPTSGGYDGIVKRVVRRLRDDYKKAAVLTADWYPWGALRLGNTKEEFKVAFVHVVTVLRSTGANFKYQMSYAMKNSGNDPTPLREFYVGKQYVDQICVSAYNLCGTKYPDMRSLATIFGSFYYQVTSFAPGTKLCMAEMGTTSYCGGKPQWIKDAWKSLAYQFTEVININWFLENKVALLGVDWDLNNEFPSGTPDAHMEPGGKYYAAANNATANNATANNSTANDVTANDASPYNT